MAHRGSPESHNPTLSGTCETTISEDQNEQVKLFFGLKAFTFILKQLGQHKDGENVNIMLDLFAVFMPKHLSEILSRQREYNAVVELL